MNTIQSEWARYSAAVLPKEANEEQIKQTKCAFYGGAACMFELIQKLAGDDVSEQAMLAIMQSIHGEFVEFCKEVT